MIVRTVAHIDMDAFFASVEALLHPEYRGKPLVVGADPKSRRGVVATCSYEARAFGIHSAMPISEAVRRCPHAIFLRPDMPTYAEFSRKAFSALEALSPVIEPVSIDEAFVDMTGCEHFYPSLEAMAAALQRAVYEATGLTASVGIAPNKFLAKLASESAKPRGSRVLRPHQVEGFLNALPIESLWGVGPKMAARLKAIGITRVGHLRRRSQGELEARIGKATAEHLITLARGEDHRPVVPEAECKSISREITFDDDISDPAELRYVLAGLVSDVGVRLRRKGLRAGAVTLKLRTPDFATKTRRRALASPAHDDDRIFQEASTLLTKAHRGEPLRLLGVGVTDFDSVEQPSLFGDDLRSEKITQVIDAINQKHRRRVLQRGRERFLLPPRKR